MTDASAAAGRPRRWWLALILNIVAAPTGYAYVGAWRWVLVAALLIVLGPMALTTLTFAAPPGVYLFGAPGRYAGLGAAALALGLHAAWLARRAPPRTGASKAVLYIAPWFLVLFANVAIRAYGPHPAYEVQDQAMAPALAKGDVVMADTPRAVCGQTSPRPGQVVVFHRGPTTHLGRVKAQATPVSWYVTADDPAQAGDDIYGAVPTTDICGVVAKVIASKDNARVGRQP